MVIPVLAGVRLTKQMSLDGYRVEQAENGVQEFVSKPIDRNELSLRVRNVLMLKQYNNLLSDTAAAIRSA